MSIKVSRRDFLKGGMGAFGASFLLPLIKQRAAAQEPLKAAMLAAGLQGAWNIQGQEAALWYGNLLNVDITWFDGELDPDIQRSKADLIASQEWDFVAIQPVSLGSLVEPVTAMVNGGAVVIGMDTLIAPFDQMQEIGVLTFIAPDNVLLAELVVEALVKKMGGTGKIAHIGGDVNTTIAQARGQGFLNIMASYPDIEVADDQAANWDQTLTANITENILNRHPDLNAIFADNDEMALAASQVVEAAGLSEQVFIGGVDALPPALQAITEGKLVATARSSAVRIHGWAVIAGAYAATTDIEQVRQDVPPFVLVDGALITVDKTTPSPRLVNTPWKLKNYGVDPVPGLVWAEEHFLL